MGHSALGPSLYIEEKPAAAFGFLLLAAGVVLWAGVARAGNEDELLVGNDAALSAGAVTATVADGSALYYNPAGLAAVERDSVDVTASAFVIRRYALPALLSTPGGERARGDFTEIVSAPTALSYVRRLSPRVTVAAGVFVPRSLDLVVRSTLRLEQEGLEQEGLETDGTVERRSEWLAALGVTQSRYLASLGLGFRLGRRARVGVSLQGVYDAGFVSSLFAGGFVSAPSRGPSAPPAAPLATEGSIQQHVLYNQVNVGVQPVWGVQLEASEHLRCGFAMRAPGVSFYSNVRTTSAVSQARHEQDLFVPGDEVRSDWHIERMLALRALGSLAYTWDGSWLAVDVDYQSRVHSASLALDLPPVINARIGARFQLNPALAVGAGVFSDRSNEAPPTGYPDTRIDFYGGTAGFELRHDYGLAAGEVSSTLSFASTLALRYARGAGQVGGVRVDLDALSPGEIAAISTPPGRATVQELSLHVGSSVYF